MSNCQHRATRNPGRVLTIAENSFRLLTTRPRPLAIDGRKIGHGLPAREVGLAELRDLLLARDASAEVKDAAWAELVRLARAGDPAWVVGCVGVAMPGLKSIAGRAIRTGPGCLAEDTVSEILTEFVAQLQRIDVRRPAIAARLLVWAARKGALRARAGIHRQSQTDPAELAELSAAPPSIPGEPEDVLAEAVRQQVITPAAAAMIQATRLDGMTLRAYAAAQGVPEKRLEKRRKTAERRLASAIRQGQVSANFSALVSDSGVCPGNP